MSKIKRFNELYEKIKENVDNSETFLQNDFNSQQFDYDYILSEMKSKHGWSDINHQRIEEFEDSEYCKKELINSDDDYVKHFNMYMDDLSNGLIQDYDNDVAQDIDNNTPILPIEEYEETIKKENNKIMEHEHEKIPETQYTSPVESSCKVLIINSCEGDKEACTVALKDSLDCDVKEINLYQLNIKDSKSENEPKDGMDLIYREIENVDAIVFACDGISMKTCLNRMCSHYKEGELKNKVFGAIFCSESEFNNELISCAINNLKMTINGDCVITEGDETSTDVTNMALCLTNLCNSTSSLRTAPKEVDQEILDYGEFVDAGQVEDPYDSSLEDELSNPNDVDNDSEEHDDFIDGLKGEISKELSIPSYDDDGIEEETEEIKKEKEKEKGKDVVSSKKITKHDDEVSKDGPGRLVRNGDVVSKDGPGRLVRNGDVVPKEGTRSIKKDENGKTYTNVGGSSVNKPSSLKEIEEEEERLIDNLDGTITHIHNGWKDTNRPKGNPQSWKKDKVTEEEEVISTPSSNYALPFTAFDDVWEKYQESKKDKTFDQFVNELYYEDHPIVKKDKREYDIPSSKRGVEISGNSARYKNMTKDEYVKDVPNDKIDSMSYQELLDLVDSPQTLSVAELDRIMARIDKIDREGNNDYYDDKYKYNSPENRNSRNTDYLDEYEEEFDNSVGVEEYEDTPNRKIDTMSYQELETLIETETNLSMDELDRLLTRIGELEKDDSMSYSEENDDTMDMDMDEEYEEDVLEKVNSKKHKREKYSKTKNESKILKINRFK